MGSVLDQTKKLRSNNQDTPRYGNKFQNMLAKLLPGWLSSDVENGNLHIHDGKRAGGFVLTQTGPLFDSYVEMIEAGFDGDVCCIRGGGVIHKTEAGWLGDLGVVVDEAAANALTGVAPGARIATQAGDSMVWAAA